MAKQISELNWKKRLLLVSYKNEDEDIFNESKTQQVKQVSKSKMFTLLESFFFF